MPKMDDRVSSRNPLAHSRKSKLREWAETFFGVLMVALFLRATVVEALWIPSPSMAPTLEIGDRLVVEKISYHFHSPQRGDIVVFQPPERLSEYGYNIRYSWVKRVIGLPGERIAVKKGQVLVNGQPLSESYLATPPVYSMPEKEIPSGEVFVMGDNRNNSADSHVWGALPVNNIIGRARICFWPPYRTGFL